MSELEVVSRVLDDAADLYDELRPILTSHASSFFVKDYFNTILTPEIRRGLLSLSEDQLRVLPSLELGVGLPEDSPAKELGAIVKRVRDAVYCSSVIRSKNEFMEELELEIPEISYVAVACADKKRHEVKEACDVIAAVCKKRGISRVTDLGSGKGHLGSTLAGYCGVDVVCVETREALAEHSAKLHERHLARIEKKVGPGTRGEFVVEADVVTASSNLYSLHPTDENFAIVGLHACGNLAVDATELYAKTPLCTFTFVVGCCYNMLVEQFDDSDPYTVKQRASGQFRFPVSQRLKERQFGLTRNARMLGLYAPQRISAVTIEKNEMSAMESTESPFYRAVMDLLMHEIGVKKKVGDRVGKAFKQSNGCFVEYSRLCWNNLKLGPDKWSAAKARELYDKCKERRMEFHAYQLLRTALSPLIEFVILVDRLLALLEKGFKNSWLVQVFDPITSPRCYALTSFKTSEDAGDS